MRLIDADALKDELKKYRGLDIYDVFDTINAQQTFYPRYPKSCPCSGCDDRCLGAYNCSEFEDWIAEK